MGYGGGGVNGSIRWKDLALDRLFPVDQAREEAEKAAQARQMASGTASNHPPSQPQPAQNANNAVTEDEDEGDDNDDDEEGGPVREDAEEVGEDLRKVLAPGDPGHGVGDEREGGPDEARHERERAAERLDRERCAVRVRDVVRAAGWRRGG